MPIGDYCEKPAATIAAEQTVRAASQRMAQEGLGSLVVVKDGGPIGIVTDRDLLLGTVCSGLEPDSVRVAEMASLPLLTVDQEAPVRDAVGLIRRHMVRRLPVVDEKGALVGMAAADDLMSLMAAELAALAVALRAQSPTAHLPPQEIEARASEHYQRQVVTIPAGAAARDAADKMEARAVGCLVVLRDGAPVGIVTDRDLLERVVAARKDPAVTPIAEVMSEPLRVASPEAPLDRIVELMSAEGIRRVPVVRDGTLVGIVALDDALVELAGELWDLANGVRCELDTAREKAGARAFARDLGERIRDLGERLEHAGAEAKESLLGELDGLRERIRGRKG